MSIESINKVLSGESPNISFLQKEKWDNYLKARKFLCALYDSTNVTGNLISDINWLLRKDSSTCEDFGTIAKVGDICFIDFGQAYIKEVGYQHFGLIISINNEKALVVPMTSNKTQYSKAYDPIDNPQGKKNLFRIGRVKGLKKPSVLFLNDAKYINMARIIDVKGCINKNSVLFKMIKRRLANIMFNDDFQ